VTDIPSQLRDKLRAKAEQVRHIPSKRLFPTYIRDVMPLAANLPEEKSCV
jgi:hypothetical protein